MAPRAFISFVVENQWARDFLVQHAKDKRNDIEFTDYSVHAPFDEKWKTNCRERIARTKGTIVLVGEDSWKSEAVKWEIAETARQENYMFGIQINSDKTHTVPAGLSAKNMIRWDFDQIVMWLATWV